MKWFIILFSIVWIACGGFLILYTDRCRGFAAKGIERLGRVPLASAALLIGILLLLSARGSLNPAVIVVLGLLAIGKGGLFIWNPNRLFEKTCRWWLDQADDRTYRLAGIITLVLGTALISWV